jgi:predicted short-subunit dehydrogenase-like oxidoreductase (DUF2520 family)
VRIGIIGAGKVGIVLGHAFKKKGLSVVGIASRRQSSIDTAREYLGEGPLYTLSNLEVVNLCDVLAVTTQDREIKNVAEEVHREAASLDGKIFFHTSGAHSSSELSPLDRKGALLGSLHPLQTFPDIAAGISVLPDTYIFIEGHTDALPVLKKLGEKIGFETLFIEGENKVLYHLSAVFVCNLLSALLYSGEGLMKKIGIDLKPFYPIIRATLKNIEAKGPLASLTGPVVRGDTVTVSSHLEAMGDLELHKKVYKDLSIVALRMAEERGSLTGEQIVALSRVLETTSSQRPRPEKCPEPDK